MKSSWIFKLNIFISNYVLNSSFSFLNAQKKKTIPNENFSQPCQPLENLDSRRNKRRLKSHRKTQKDLVKVSQSSGEGKKKRKEEENKQKKPKQQKGTWKMNAKKRKKKRHWCVGPHHFGAYPVAVASFYGAAVVGAAAARPEAGGRPRHFANLLNDSWPFCLHAALADTRTHTHTHAHAHTAHKSDRTVSPRRRLISMTSHLKQNKNETQRNSHAVTIIRFYLVSLLGEWISFYLVSC